jgi:murein DD-endopeptidase MepM/ murein hydrolase activator NlpD
LILLIVLAACQAARAGSGPLAGRAQQPVPLQTGEAAAPPEPYNPTPSMPASLPGEAGSPDSEMTAPQPARNAPGSEPPLRFTLPTPGPVPISLWRPPLYEIPWALGPNDHFFFSRPIAADEVNWPIADYRYGGIFFGSDIIHTGVDIPSPRNTPILAAAGGKVVWAGYGLFYGNDNPDDPYGLAVTIRHDFGYQGRRLYTVYAHMDAIKVVTGQEVQTGDVLGLVGTTGLTTGPHLHFEVRMERSSYFTTYNPELWMAPPQGWGVLVGRLHNENGSMLSRQDVTVRNLETRQKWVVRSYGEKAVNSDPYYNENLVLSDLPAGRYEVSLTYLDNDYSLQLDIYPGAISYFRFRGKLYFDTKLPAAPSIEQVLAEE